MLGVMSYSKYHSLPDIRTRVSHLPSGTARRVANAADDDHARAFAVLSAERRGHHAGSLPRYRFQHVCICNTDGGALGESRVSELRAPVHSCGRSGQVGPIK